MVRHLLIIEADGGCAELADHLPNERRFRCEHARRPWPHRPPLEQADLVVAVVKGVQSFERLYIIDMLRRHRGNITRAARASGKERRAFGRLVKKSGAQLTAPF